MSGAEIVLFLILAGGIACSIASDADVKRACQKSYDDGYQKGHDDGYNKGYDIGYEDGYEEGRWEKNE